MSGQHPLNKCDIRHRRASPFTGGRPQAGKPGSKPSIREEAAGRYFVRNEDWIVRAAQLQRVTDQLTNVRRALRAATTEEESQALAEGRLLQVAERQPRGAARWIQLRVGDTDRIALERL